ncbi:MAG TPA: HAMP domain-containing sensor histidine kinase [Gemmatimonadaceae bacterium]|nr:HAMP domain-containing sensor histidine kinase [Gemmatimonadaceae bacterium]
MSMITSVFGRRTRPILLAGALVSIVLGATLGVRESVRTRREQRAAAEHTMSDYANFAAYLYTTRAYLFARDRSRAFDPIHPGWPWLKKDLPPATVLAAIPDTTEMCGPPGKFPVYRFRLDMPERTVTFAGTPPPPRVAAFIRDSVPGLASTEWVGRAGFGYAFVEGDDGPEAVAFSPATDSTDKEKVLAVYGYRSCYGVRDTTDYALMYRVVRVLPPALTKMMPSESLLTLTVRDGKGKVLFKAPRNGASSAVYGYSEMKGIGNTSYKVEIRPEVAKMLVIGGMPDAGAVPASVVLLTGSIILAIAGFATLRTELGLFNSRERFLANVSHELRTPLQQILTFVQLLRLGRARTEAERQRSLEIIETETHRLIALSDTVMSAAAPKRRELANAPIEVDQVVRNAAAFFQPLARARKMCIDLDIEPATALGDAHALKQILVNVLDNAAKYGPVGQTITIGLRDDPDRVRLWVDDHGPGVPAEDRSRVWKPFLRLHRKVEQSTGGAGLGLSIVHDLATEMGAEVEISDAPTGGARFSLSLQRVTAAEGALV